MKNLKLGLVLMAAGASSRFGSNKLMVKFQGKSLIERALNAVPRQRFERMAVVSQHKDILDMAEKLGMRAALNTRPDLGVSRTIALGLDAMEGMDAVMFMVADQPCLTHSSVEAQIDFFLRQPDSIVAMGFGKRRGNPVIFPSRYFEELRELQGDAGGSFVICRHEDKLRLYQAEDELELFDTDSATELDELNDRLSRRI